MENNDAGAAVAPSMPDAQSSPEPSSSPEAGSGTTRDSIDRAFAQAFDDSPERASTEPAEKSETRTRDDAGRFAKGDEKAAAEPVEPQEAKPATDDATKPAAPLDEPPARFSADAKAAWATLPESVKGETRRAFAEMERGLNEYQQTVAPLKPFLDMAEKGGTSLPQALSNYVGIEQMLRSDLPAGLAKICENMGVNFRDVAAQVMGQTPDQTASQADTTIRELRQHISRLEQQVGGVTSTIEQQQQAALQQQVQAFAAERPRFEELKPVMAQLLQGGIAPDLAQAYEMADRLNPGSAPQPAPAPVPAAPAAKPDLSAQTRKGSLSVTGAPSSGSNPANRKPPSSNREALDRAFAAAGLA